jgi:menaquinone-9 beta-reductase
LDESIELHYDKNILPVYGWIFPVNEDVANVGVGIFTRFTDKKV